MTLARMLTGWHPSGGQLAAVLHHDLRLDLRRTCQVIMSARNGLPDFAVAPSAIGVVTPFNIP